MLVAGVAWGVYSLRAKGSGDPLRVTAGSTRDTRASRRMPTSMYLLIS